MYKQSNQNMMMDDPDRPPHQGAFPVWSKVFTKPNQQSFLDITTHPDATAKNAYIWVFAAGTLSGLIGSLTQLVLGVTALRQAMPEINQLPGFSTGFGIGGILGAICAAPLAGIFSVIGFAISVALIHWVARFLGGQGNFDKIAYAFGAITAPVMVVSAFLVPVNAIPYASYCILPLSLLMGLFTIYLQMTAVKAVHGFGWLESAIAVFLPVILVVFLCAFTVLGIMKTLGSSATDIFQQIQQGL
jgi:hypothetical protein